MGAYSVALILLIASIATGASADDQTVIEERVLKNRLDGLESQAIQRQRREPTTLDLLNRQDDAIAGQTLNRLKTERPRSRSLHRLERKLDRSRRTRGGR